MKIKKTAEKRGFILVECVMALALLMILTGGLIAAFKVMDKMDRDFLQEQQGLLVVDNTLERLEHCKKYSYEQVKKIFDDEFKTSGINSRSGMSAVAQKLPDGDAKLSILNGNRKTLIEVKIKCRP